MGTLRPAAAMAIMLWLGSGAAWGQHSAAAPARNNVRVSDLSATTFDGATFDIAGTNGKIILLDFWATWCSPCLEAFPALKALQKRFDEDQFQVISVALFSGDAEQLQWVVDQYQLSHTMLTGDKNVPVVFDILGFPTYLLMDRHGKLLRRYVGDFNDPVGRVARDVGLLLDGQSIAEAQTP